MSEVMYGVNLGKYDRSFSDVPLAQHRMRLAVVEMSFVLSSLGDAHILCQMGKQSSGMNRS